MEHSIRFNLRPANPKDIPFTETLYIDSMRPLMTQLNCWNESRRRAAFHRSYIISEVSIIMVEGKDVGWMQVSERDNDTNLAQIQILEEYCGGGIGTQIVNNLLHRAKQFGKSVSLSAVRTNRAIGFYKKLGFRIVDPDATPILDLYWSEEN